MLLAKFHCMLSPKDNRASQCQPTEEVNNRSYLLIKAIDGSILANKIINFISKFTVHKLNLVIMPLSSTYSIYASIRATKRYTVTFSIGAYTTMICLILFQCNLAIFYSAAHGLMIIKFGKIGN